MWRVSPDVIVIGAGAIGTSIAYQLAKAGAKVMVFDRGLVGREATGASAGMIMAHRGRDTAAAYAALSHESARLFAALADELKDRTGMDIGYRRAGLLRVAFDEIQEHELRSQRAWEVDRGGIVPWLDARSALDVEPALNPAVRAAIYYPNDHQVLPLALAQALARATADLGAIVREGAAIDRLLVEGDRVVGVGIGDEAVLAAEVVIANGAWASAWSQLLRAPIPIRPVRGQMLALQTVATGLRAVVNAGDGYLMTKPDGLTYVGATVEEVGYDPRPTAAGIAGLLGLVPRLAPRFADAAFSHAWAGLRPATPDGLPLIGRVPGWQGVTIAGGHFRNGILLAPITAELIADLLGRRRPRLAIEAFDPGRFLVRAA